MKLQTGIVGLPNVGKSTLFNALVGSETAQAANFPFCTIGKEICRVTYMGSLSVKLRENLRESQPICFMPVEGILVSVILRWAEENLFVTVL